MLNKLMETIKKLSRETITVDPQKFNDPLALQVEWTPAKRGGSSFRTHKLIMVSGNRLEFRPAVGAVLFALVFILAGLGIFSAGAFMLYEDAFQIADQHIIMMLIGLVFMTISLILFFYLTRPAVFDTMYGYYWKGRKKADFGIGNSQPEVFTPLNQIHALQIISEFVRSNKSSYYSYELNLVLKDGSRKNVVDHGNIARLREDVDQLSHFLGKPVWDASL